MERIVYRNTVDLLLSKAIDRLSTPATSVLHNEGMDMLHDDSVTLDWREVAQSIRWTADNHIDRRTRA